MLLRISRVVWRGGYCINWNFIVNIVQRNNNNKNTGSKNNIKKKTINRNGKK